MVGNREKWTKEQLISQWVYEGFMSIWKSEALKMEKGGKKMIITPLLESMTSDSSEWP